MTRACQRVASMNTAASNRPISRPPSAPLRAWPPCRAARHAELRDPQPQTPEPHPHSQKTALPDSRSHLAQRGAQVVGIDAARGNVAAARLHAASEGVLVDYRLGEPTAALRDDERFDVVLALEVVEHVSDVNTFVATAARCVAPGGMLFASTIDRTLKSFLLAIVGAEYLLRVLPRGTHEWQRFVRPAELTAAVGQAGLVQTDLRGMRYLPLVHRASWTRDTRVNYIAAFARQVCTGRPEQP